jgi:streptogramin lyase
MDLEDQTNHKIGVITPYGDVREYDFPTSRDEGGWDINASPDGNLWFTEDYAIGEIVLRPAR